MTQEEELRYLRRRVAELEAQQGHAAADAPALPPTQALLATQPQLVHQVMEANPQPICVQDEAGRLLFVNDAYARLRQRSRAELLAPAEAEPLPNAEWPAADAPLSTEVCHQLPGTEPAWYHVIRTPFAGPDGRRCLLSIFADVTALKQARLAAEESARAKEVFLANMSHEIRTPMHGVVGLARLLKKTPVTAEQAEYLDLILTNAGNLLVVINDILDFAKMEAGHLELEARPFDVAATVRGVARSLALVAEGKGLRLTTELPAAPLPTVLGDPVRLSQVLINLINNAIKFTSQGSITVTVQADAPAPGADGVGLRFSVQDTGIGIAPEQVEHVFQSFAQASTNTARLYGGTGLGLAICRHLVELQHGRIGLASELGRGSCFYFTLTYPLTDQPAADAHEVPPQLPPGLLRGLRVLLVEDNPVNQLLACSLLQEWQAEAQVAADGEQALHLAGAAPFDVVLMDIQMPRLNGLEATAELRRRPGPNQHTPIVALTANALKSDVDTYPHAGFSDWLVKPYHEHNLYQVLARNTGRSQPPPVTPPAPVAEAPTYGFAGLGRLANDPAFIRKLQQLYVDTVPGQLAQLGEALRTQDWAAAARLVHSLKSTFGNLQIDEALGEIKKIEGQLKKFPDSVQLLKLYHSVHHTASQATAVFTAQLQD